MTTAPPTGNLLLVTPDNALRANLATHLAGRGHVVHETGYLEQGLKVARTQEPDLVLLDLETGKTATPTPGCHDDLPAMETLRTLHGEFPHTPVVVLAQRGQEDEVIRAFRLGASDYIPLPPDRSDLVDRTVHNCLTRSRLEEKVRHADERYFRLIQHLPVVVFSFGADTGLDFINNTAHEILGFTPSELLADPGTFFNRIHADDRERLREAFDNSVAECQCAFSVEFRFEHKQGYWINLVTRSIPQPSATSGPPRMEGVIMDVTDRAWMERFLLQSERLGTLGSISHELAHEIRNPLMAIGGFARKLAKKAPELEESGIILEEAKRLEELLNRIRTYLEPVEASIRPTSVNELLSLTSMRLAATFGPDTVSFERDLAPDLPEASADPDILSQVFVTLIHAMTTRTPTGEPIRLRSFESAHHVNASLAVRRTDLDLPDADKLFLPFEADDTQLAVAAAYRQVQQMGGLLSTDYRDNEAVFVLALPKA